MAHAPLSEAIPVIPDKQWNSVEDLCTHFDVSEFVMTSMLRRGEIPAVKMGREWRVHRDDLSRWLDDQKAV